MTLKRKYDCLIECNLIDKNDVVMSVCIKSNIIERIHKKQKLIDHLYTQYCKSVVIIRKIWKIYLLKIRIFDIISRNSNGDDNYMNKYNLIDKIHTDIDKEYFYKIKINSNRYYFFDIRCIHKLFTNNYFKNPYTLQDYKPKIIKQIRRIIWKLKQKNKSLIITNDIPEISYLTSLSSSVHNKLMAQDVYPNLDLLNTFNITYLYYYLQNLIHHPVLKDYINQTHYNNFMNLYNRQRNVSYTYFGPQTERNNTDNTIKKKMIICILNIISTILDHEDTHIKLRARIIHEILHNIGVNEDIRNNRYNWNLSYYVIDLTHDS